MYTRKALQKIAVCLSLYANVAFASPMHSLTSSSDPGTLFNQERANKVRQLAECVSERNTKESYQDQKLVSEKIQIKSEKAEYTILIRDVNENHPSIKNNSLRDEIEILKTGPQEKYMVSDRGLDGHVNEGVQYKPWIKGNPEETVFETVFVNSFENNQHTTMRLQNKSRHQTRFDRDLDILRGTCLNS